MAMSSMEKICDPSGFLIINQLSFYGIYDGKKIKRDIKKIIVVK
jgi:hypothetical protein